MAERSTITQVVQLGMEVTPGTPVAATKRLQTLDFQTKVMSNEDHFRPAGYKFETITAQEREWTEAPVRGQPTYTEIVYPLSSVITKATPSTILDGATDTTGRKWVFEPSTSSPDDPQSFTVEQGSSVRAHQYAQAMFREFGLNFTREKLDMSGALLARSISDNFVLTGGTTSVPLVPMLAKQFSVYLDNTAAGLGTTKLGRLFTGAFALGARFGPVWVVDSALPSYADTVETVPTLNFKLLVEANTQGMALLDYLRSGATYFLRIEALGPDIYAAGVFAVNHLKYRFTLDMAVEVTTPEPFSDHQGVYAVGFTMTGVHDAAWGKAMHVEVVNKQTAL